MTTLAREQAPMRGRVGTCGRRMTTLVDAAMLHLRAIGWPVPAVLFACGAAGVRTFGLARGGEVAQSIRERRIRHALQREAGRSTPSDPTPEPLWRALLAALDDRTAMALVLVADARKRRDPEVLAWLTSGRPVHTRRRSSRLTRRSTR